jgi:3-deoxy-D-manno-octulosonic-acid transferase
MRLFLFFYELVWVLALPWVALYLWWRGRRAKAYRERRHERFGFYRSQKPVDIWIHAVSMGEVVATRSVVQACLDKGWKVLITTMTPTGSQQVKRMWGESVEHQYCPYDFSWAVIRFLKDRKPKLLMIFETEIWPGILLHCQRSHIPVILANARISNRSYGRYLKTRWLWRHMLNAFSMIFAQSEQDMFRLVALGTQPEKIRVAGNLKFMQAHQVDIPKHWKTFKLINAHRFIVVWGSTHADEEEKLLREWSIFENHHPDALLMVVPRHPERFDIVYRLLQQAFPAQVARFSQLTAFQGNMKVLLVDAMGELSALYAIADCAFVGGSFVPIGGHNVLEAVAEGIPVLTGPFMHNQQDMARILLEKNAMIQVNTSQECMAVIHRLKEDEVFYQEITANGQMVIQQHQNALAIHMKGVEALI